MSLSNYFAEIESLEFQVQFSVISGFKILQLAMQQQPTLVKLMSEMRRDTRLAAAVSDRIKLLLKKVDSETQLSYDESIAAYLFCLAQVDLLTTYRASWHILEQGGLWWSVQLALWVKKLSQQKLESVDTSRNKPQRKRQLADSRLYPARDHPHNP